MCPDKNPPGDFDQVLACFLLNRICMCLEVEMTLELFEM